MPRGCHAGASIRSARAVVVTAAASDAATAVDAAPDACVIPVCVDHACTSGPAPRDRLCNSNQDQCDGAGHCVDCTTSGGCDECCACFAQVCQPV